MALTFADTHNMIAFLTKSYTSEGFEQIIDFLNASVIQYALVVNPTIYASFIKQFWSSVLIKKTNDVVRLQALIDRRKVIITKATVRQAIHLDDADSIDCLPNEEIFVELARIGYEKPFIKLTFYKAFFSVDTPLFEGMLVPQQVQVNIDVVGDDEDVTKPTSPTPATTLPPPQELIPSSSQVVTTPPPSPHQSPSAQPTSPPQQQPSPPSQSANISMDLLNTLRLEKKNKLKASGLKRLRKVGTAQRVESSVDTVMDDQEDSSKQGGIIAKIDADEDVTLEEVDAENDAKVAKDAAIQGRLESQAQVYHLDLKHSQTVLSMQDDEAKPAELKEVIEVVTTAKLMTKVVIAAATTITVAPSAARRKKGVVIRDPEETSTPSIILHSESKSKDKGKAFWKEKQDNVVLRYQALKRKPQTKAHARKNMMEYLKNMAGFKMDFFKGMSYNDTRPIFEKHFNSIVAFLKKGKKELEDEASKAIKRKSKSSEQQATKKQKLDEEVEEFKTHLQIVLNDEDDVYTKSTPLALKVPAVDYQIHTENNKPYYKIIRADGTHQLSLSFISLLRNYDREDLEMLWQIVQARIASSEPKNFSDDFLLNTLKAMFEKPNVEAIIWKS
uniref:Xylulose kinase-1 n=1 Tax=Tanacetum cinerariifolium TaxID=118510 RepID=A0A6L2LDZ0_TANCI|nr:xylulose kinase-1 [Tanacetum cinerariifolium]